MSRWTIVLLGLVALMLWQVRSSRWLSGESQPETAAVPPVAAPGSVELEVERDKALVFQRAFWRRPGADDRILHAERREWKDATGVQKWQWFVAVEPSASLREWLLTTNPFELAAGTSAEIRPIENPPNWFPSLAERVGFTCYYNREGYFRVFFNAATNRIFATDGGAGFALSQK